MKMYGSDTDYVAIMMDDIYLPQYDLGSFLNIMHLQQNFQTLTEWEMWFFGQVSKQFET